MTANQKLFSDGNSVFELKLLSCSFITPTTTAPTSTAASQESRPYSTYQVQCFTAACKLMLHPNSNSNWRHLWPLTMLRVEYHRGLTIAWLTDHQCHCTNCRPYCNRFSCKIWLMAVWHFLPRSSLAAVQASGFARIKREKISESSPVCHPGL